LARRIFPYRACGRSCSGIFALAGRSFLSISSGWPIPKKYSGKICPPKQIFRSKTAHRHGKKRSAVVRFPRCSKRGVPAQRAPCRAHCAGNGLNTRCGSAPGLPCRRGPCTAGGWILEALIVAHTPSRAITLPPGGPVAGCPQSLATQVPRVAK
jgi:hypothetical protein